jgi:FkbM family methyltransferase
MAYCLSFQNAGLKQINGLERRGAMVYFRKTGNAICISHLPVFEFSINPLIDLLQHPKVAVDHVKPYSFMAVINGLRFNVASLSNMAVLYEIFIEEIYAVDLMPDNILLLDIGMNVGVASQYFASNAKVKAVYGYEPFLETYQEALTNLRLNESIQQKIFCNQYGVSGVSEKRKIHLFDSGLLSASTIQNDGNEYGKDTSKTIEVELRSIRSIFDELYPQYPNSPVVLKIDCEGEEYAIFESLRGTNYLNRVACVLVEWHEKGSDAIVEVLKKHGFQMLLLPHATANSGMIYGFKQSSF